MDGSTHQAVFAPGPKSHSAWVWLLGLIVIATLVASFAVGRVTARPDDVGPAGTSQVVGDLVGGPPRHDGDVKRG